jgi:hypothetical protein
VRCSREPSAAWAGHHLQSTASQRVASAPTPPPEGPGQGMRSAGGPFPAHADRSGLTRLWPKGPTCKRILRQARWSTWAAIGSISIALAPALPLSSSTPGGETGRRAGAARCSPKRPGPRGSAPTIVRAWGIASLARFHARRTAADFALVASSTAHHREIVATPLAGGRRRPVSESRRG